MLTNQKRWNFQHVQKLFNFVARIRYNLQESLYLLIWISKVFREVIISHLITKISLSVGQDKFTVQCCEITHITKYSEAKFDNTVNNEQMLRYTIYVRIFWIHCAEIKTKNSQFDDPSACSTKKGRARKVKGRTGKRGVYATPRMPWDQLLDAKKSRGEDLFRPLRGTVAAKERANTKTIRGSRPGRNAPRLR